MKYNLFITLKSITKSSKKWSSSCQTQKIDNAQEQGELSQINRCMFFQIQIVNKDMKKNSLICHFNYSIKSQKTNLFLKIQTIQYFQLNKLFYYQIKIKHYQKPLNPINIQLYQLKQRQIIFYYNLCSQINIHIYFTSNQTIMKKILFFSILLLILIIRYNLQLPNQPVIIDSQQGKKAQIYRDDKGIPHIFAHKVQDVLFGMGYAEAQDRLWSLLVKKFLIQGRMSQVFGREGLLSDYFARNFKFHQVGVMNAQLLDQQTRKRIQSYCDGINYYARNTKFLPIQFYVFWFQWQDWTIQNTLGMLAFSSFSLQFDWMYQIARQRLLQTVGFDLAYQIMNFGSKTLFREVTIMKQSQLKQQNQWKQYDQNKQYEILKQHWANKMTTLGSVHLPTYQYQGSGSNAWVIGGNHTDTGKPFLANDPHLGSLTPPAFYACQLGLLDQHDNVLIQSFGVSLSGFPSISIGINKHHAWGSTASYVDNKDLFYQTVRVKDQIFQYFHENQWKNFTAKEQVYKVRWQGQQQKISYENHRGPVIQDIFDQIYYKYSYPLPLKYRINHTITLNAAIYHPDPTSAKGLIGVTFAQDFTQFKLNGTQINAPNIDSVYINSTGNFGYAAVGRNPIRQVYEMSGFMKDGTVSTYQMKGFIQDKPKVDNPSKGYVAMCNNKFAPDEYINRGSLHQITTGRAYRLQKIITQKIASGKKFTLEDMKAMQLDYTDQFLSQAFPLVLKSLQSTRYIWSNSKTEKFYQLLKNWNYDMKQDSVQSTIYHVWERLLQSSFLIGSGLNQQQRQAIINHAFFENYQFRLFEKIHNKQLSNQQKPLCQNSQTKNFTNLHPCQASIAIAFKKIPEQIQKIFGTNDISKYKWGSIHLMTYKAIPFSDIPLIGKIWQRNTPYGGNSRTLNVGIMTHQSKGQNKYRAVAGPVFRFVTDLNTTYWSLDIGNSGNLFSESYDNFLGTNQYVPYKAQNPKKKMPQNWRLIAKSR